MQTVKQTTFDAEGMTCASCVRHVQGALRELEGVGEVQVELHTGKVRVKHAGGATVAEMVAALGEAGYPSRLTSDHEGR